MLENVLLLLHAGFLCTPKCLYLYLPWTVSYIKAPSVPNTFPQLFVKYLLFHALCRQICKCPALLSFIDFLTFPYFNMFI